MKSKYIHLKMKMETEMVKFDIFQEPAFLFSYFEQYLNPNFGGDSQDNIDSLWSGYQNEPYNLIGNTIIVNFKEKIHNIYYDISVNQTNNDWYPSEIISHPTIDFKTIFNELKIDNDVLQEKDIIIFTNLNDSYNKHAISIIIQTDRYHICNTGLGLNNHKCFKDKKYYNIWKSYSYPQGKKIDLLKIISIYHYFHIDQNRKYMKVTYKHNEEEINNKHYIPVSEYIKLVDTDKCTFEKTAEFLYKTLNIVLNESTEVILCDNIKDSNNDKNIDTLRNYLKNSNIPMFKERPILIHENNIYTKKQIKGTCSWYSVIWSFIFVLIISNNTTDLVKFLNNLNDKLQQKYSKYINSLPYFCQHRKFYIDDLNYDQFHLRHLITQKKLIIENKLEYDRILDYHQILENPIITNNKKYSNKINKKYIDVNSKQDISYYIDNKLSISIKKLEKYILCKLEEHAQQQIDITNDTEKIYCIISKYGIMKSLLDAKYIYIINYIYSKSSLKGLLNILKKHTKELQIIEINNNVLDIQYLLNENYSCLLNVLNSPCQYKLIVEILEKIHQNKQYLDFITDEKKKNQ